MHQNGATIRTVLALRHNLLSNSNYVNHLEQGFEVAHEDGNTIYTNNGNNVRIVVQLSAQCRYHRALEFRSPISHQQLLYPMDLSLFLNKLLFWCTAKPGLAKVLTTIINFEDTAIRCRPAYMLELTDTDAKDATDKNGLVGKTMKEAIIGARWWDGQDRQKPGPHAL